MLPCYVLRLERDKDRARFARLYDGVQRPLHRLAVRTLGPGPRAEDAVHDTFISGGQDHGPGYAPEGPP